MSEQTNDLPELDLDPVDDAPAAAEVAETPPAEVVAEPAAADAAAADDGAEGQWVWQYGAPPPPPSFGAAFFSGNALPELYRFFACGLLVVVGCFLPWGPISETVANPDFGTDVEASETIEQVMSVPDRLGVETALGALSLAIGLWLVFSSCYGIYTRRQKILPVFLMLEPAIVSWLALLDAHGQVGMDGGLVALLDAAGTGVLLTLIGSTLVSVQFLFVVGKVYAKKDDKGAARKARSGAKDKGKDKEKDAKGGDDAKSEGDAAAKGGKGRRGKRR